MQKKPTSQKSSPEYLLDRPAPKDHDPATFAELLRIAADAGVSEFTAGTLTVKFSQAVATHWALRNRIVVDGKGRVV